ncbi:hypothetical protein F5141DRAFT_1067753 [Pisolithus sp. B1]|nr:hypothetical protein F5141DRAFT_1067753 [Pisolithus sp. B1]
MPSVWEKFLQMPLCKATYLASQYNGTGMVSISARRLCMELGEINLEGCPAEVLGKSLYQHIYSNGHICASILGTEWSPVLICSHVARPMHNDRYVWTAPNNLKKLFLDPDAVVALCKKK